MSEAKLEIELPSELLFLLRETEESFKEKVKIWTSIKLFEDKKLSLFEEDIDNIERAIKGSG
jgi:hypothetical protein